MNNFITSAFAITLVLHFSSCISSSSSQSEQEPDTIFIPVANLGEVSDVRRKILQNTLNGAITTKFRIVPQERFEETQDQAFQELDYDKCNEDQFIMLIQEMLQVVHLFQLEVVLDGHEVH